MEQFIFTHPTNREVKMGGSTFFNPSINLNHCTHLTPSESEGMSTIRFYFIDGTSLEWFYSTSIDRDVEYEQLISN